MVNFLDELPHLEAAARRKLYCFLLNATTYFYWHFILVSIHTVSSTVATLSAGLAQVQTEIKLIRQGKLKVSLEDRFIQVMEVMNNMSTVLIPLSDG